MINPLDLRPDLAEALSTYGSKTDHGLLMMVTTAFMPSNDFNVEAQLAFAMTMTLAVLPTIECYDKEWSNRKSYLTTVKLCWKHNRLLHPDLLKDNLKVKTEHQALDEACLVLHFCKRILYGRAICVCFEQIIDLVTEGYAILPAVHPEETEMFRDWMFDEVIPYCAAGALPPFIYTINGVEPTATALKWLLKYD